MAFNILLVDDSSIVRKFLTKTLKLSGVQIDNIFEATNGKEGLEVLDREQVSLVFLDINMPVMTGVEFLKVLRSHPAKKETPVVVISTEGSKIRAQELFELGIQAQLKKPVKPEDLAETLGIVMHGESA